MMRPAHLALLLLLPACMAQTPLPTRTLTLLGPAGQNLSLRIEVAATDETRRVGLMNRTHLDDAAGMLFLYPRMAGGLTIRMWMRNTLIPLDMIFIQGDTVTAIHAGAIPHDETIITSPEGTTAVLEVNGGWAARHGVTPGWSLRLVQESAAVSR